MATLGEQAEVIANQALSSISASNPLESRTCFRFKHLQSFPQAVQPDSGQIAPVSERLGKTGRYRASSPVETPIQTPFYCFGFWPGRSHRSLTTRQLCGFDNLA